MNLSSYKFASTGRDKVKRSYLLACRYDIESIKPGNVNLLSGHHDSNFNDFVSSYDVTCEFISSNNYTLGDRIFNCINETQSVVKKNTNLGIILLCSLFSQALCIKSDITIRDAIKEVVSKASGDDVRLLCESIHNANPAGLGKHNTYDVRSVSGISLLDLMTISSEYDSISKQYATSFQDIFEFIIPCLH